MIEWIRNIDVGILLAINGHFNPFLDQVMWIASAVVTWVPFYVFLVALLIYKFKKDSLPMILLVILLVLLTDQTSSALIRPLVARWRPSHTVGLDQMLHYVNNYQGGDYGFVSSHAANVFGLSFYLTFIVGHRIKWLPWVLFPWASFVCYSRMYLGVHFPSDILGGITVGIFYAWLMSRIYFRIKKKQEEKQNRSSVAGSQFVV